ISRVSTATPQSRARAPLPSAASISSPRTTRCLHPTVRSTRRRGRVTSATPSRCSIRSGCLRATRRRSVTAMRSSCLDWREAVLPTPPCRPGKGGTQNPPAPHISTRRPATRGPGVGAPAFGGTTAEHDGPPAFYEQLMPSPRRIDIHFHLIPPFYQEAVYAAGAEPAIGRYPDWSPERALALMDQSGIELALTSLAQPGVPFCDRAKALSLAARCNDY